jgi:hypothetical protein
MALSPTSSRPSGGSTPVTAREQCWGNAVSIANGGIAAITWDHTLGPNTLLDRTDPAAPVVVAAGVYTVGVVVEPGADLTAGGTYAIVLGLDIGGDIANFWGWSTGQLSDVRNVTVNGTWYLPAGAELRINCRNHDGAATRSFVLDAAYVQRISDPAA